MDHDANQSGSYANFDYGSRSGSYAEPQSVTDVQSGGAYGYGTAGNEGVYSRAAHEERVVEDGAGMGYTFDIKAGMDHDSVKGCNYANKKYMSRSESYSRPQTVADKKSGREYGYGFESYEDVHSRAIQEERDFQYWGGYTADSRAGIDHDESQECDFTNSIYGGRSGSYAGPKNVTDVKPGGVKGYRNTRNHGVHCSDVQEEVGVEHGIGYTDDISAVIANHDAIQECDFFNSEYVSPPGSYPGPQTVNVVQPGEAYGNVNTSNQEVHSRAVQAEGNVEHGTRYSDDISAGFDHDAIQECGFTNSEYVSHSGSYAEKHTNEKSGGLFGYTYGSASDEGANTETARLEFVDKHGAGHCGNIFADTDHDASQEGDRANEHYFRGLSEWQTGTQNIIDKQAVGVNGHRYGRARDEEVYSESGKKGGIRLVHKTAGSIAIGCDDASMNGIDENNQYDIRSDSHVGAHRGAEYGYIYESANDGPEHGEVTQQENVKCWANCTFSGNGGTRHDVSQKGSFELHGNMSGEICTKIEQAENFTESEAGGTATGYGRGVDSDATQPGCNGSFLHGNNIELNGANGRSSAHRGPTSKTMRLNQMGVTSESFKLRMGLAQQVKIIFKLRPPNTETTKIVGSMTLQQPTQAHTHIWNVTWYWLVREWQWNLEKEQPAVSDEVEQNLLAGQIRLTKSKLKNILRQHTHLGAAVVVDRRISVLLQKELIALCSRPQDENHSEPRTKVPPKKPFGEKKNIHTIFTLSEGDTRPIKHIKGNVVGFGD